jgi:pimeloyl-ACP methyl ester carboxylesterase
MKGRRLTFGRVLAGIVALLLVAYGGAIVWLVTNETRLVFGAPQTPGDREPTRPYEVNEYIASVESKGPPAKRAWFMPATGPDAGVWVIFLHGKDTTLASRLNILHCDNLRALGLNVLAAEYRGFGGLPGVPTEAGLAEDAQYWYDYLRREKHVEPRRIVIYGWSLGSAVAVTLASRVDEAAVILEGAPASIVAIGEQRYPMFPVRRIIRNPFESILRVGAVRSPMLFLHSVGDAIVPIEEGRRLFEAAAMPKQFVEVSGGHVYASERDPGFFPAIRTFLRGQQLLP